MIIEDTNLRNKTEEYQKERQNDFLFDMFYSNVVNGIFSRADLILEMGLDINYYPADRRESYVFPLIHQKDYFAIQYLISRNYNFNVKSSTGNTPLEEAEFWFSERDKHWRLSPDKAQVLCLLANLPKPIKGE